MEDLAAALSAYSADRRDAALPQTVPVPADDEQEALSSANAPALEAEAHVFEGDDEKIRIAGVHARWPAVLLIALGLGAAALYQADRTGKIHLRRDAMSLLHPAHLAADLPLAARAERRLPEIALVRGVYARETSREAIGGAALRALPEAALDEGAALSAESTITQLSDAEQARRRAAYRDYLTSQGLTPLREVLQPDPPPAPEE
jgi:hypothetical protein